MMYDNGNEFLRGEIKESELKMKQKFIEDVEYTCRWWKPKAIRRYKNIYTSGRIKEEQLFYWDVIDLPWDITKSKYINEVGR